MQREDHRFLNNIKHSEDLIYKTSVNLRRTDTTKVVGDVPSVCPPRATVRGIVIVGEVGATTVRSQCHRKIAPIDIIAGVMRMINTDIDIKSTDITDIHPVGTARALLKQSDAAGAKTKRRLEVKVVLP